jgi:hypothetical protein
MPEMRVLAASMRSPEEKSGCREWPAHTTSWRNYQKRMRAQHLRQIALLIRSRPTNDVQHLNSQALDLLCVGCVVVSNGDNAFGEFQAIML